MINNLNCPKCQVGKIYEKERNGFLEKICFACGYFEDNSQLQLQNAKLNSELLKAVFLHQRKIHPSPEIDRRFSSPEELTEPINSNDINLNQTTILKVQAML
jgi:hypothetical protein